MNFSTLITLAVSAVLVTLVINTSANNITFGSLNNYSRLLDSKYIRVKHSTFRVTNEYVKFPFNGRPNYSTIQAIRVEDHKKKDGGVASLTQGGPGARNATIRLRSDRNHGLDYTIYVYGN